MPFLPQYSHNLDTSVVLWLDNKLCNDAQAYINIPTGSTNGLLYPQISPSTQGYVWAAPFKSWVFDSCVSGATICSGVYTSSGQFLTASSGIVIDYLNGRIISPYNWGATLSGAYARKQVNVYFSTEEETNFWLEHVYQENVNISYTNTGGPLSRFTAPCIILTNATTNNQQFALGGMRQTDNTIRAFIISDSNYLQEGINSLLADTAQKYIPIATYADAPLGVSGNLKGADYNYCTGIYNYYGCKTAAYIQNVTSYKMRDVTNQNNTYLLSIVDMELNRIRVI